jgi:hypothetical protein
MSSAHRGIDDRRVKLGCVQPGETVATFGDALRRLMGAATYLYEDGTRYWYSTVPTVTRMAEGRSRRESLVHLAFLGHVERLSNRGGRRRMFARVRQEADRTAFDHLGSPRYLEGDGNTAGGRRPTGSARPADRPAAESSPGSD